MQMHTCKFILRRLACPATPIGAAFLSPFTVCIHVALVDACCCYTCGGWFWRTGPRPHRVDVLQKITTFSTTLRVILWRQSRLRANVYMCCMFEKNGLNFQWRHHFMWHGDLLMTLDAMSGWHSESDLAFNYKIAIMYLRVNWHNCDYFIPRKIVLPCWTDSFRQICRGIFSLD